MNARTKRGFAATSAVGAALFVGVFAWLWLLGVLPFEVFALLAVLNLVVGAYSLKLAVDAGD
jgi:hypothetical protein